MKTGLASISLALATGALALTACGSDDDTSADAVPAKPAALAITVKPVGAKGAEYVMPATVAGGVVTITLDNTTKFPREAQLLRADGEHAAAEVKRAVDADAAPIPAWLHAAGGVDAKPNSTSTVTTDLRPGNYFVSDTGDPDFTGKAARMATFTVTAGDSRAKLPTVSAQIVASEYAFEGTNLKAGTNQVRFRNAGKEVHHAIMFPLKGQATIAAVAKFFKTEGKTAGPPPIDFEPTSIMALDGGSEQISDVTLKAGRYAAVCFVTDRAGGPPHFVKGQISELTVQ